MSTTIWIVVGLGVVGLMTVVRFALPRRRGEAADLGSVSEQWIAEHRAGQWGDRLR